MKKIIEVAYNLSNRPTRQAIHSFATAVFGHESKSIRSLHYDPKSNRTSFRFFDGETPAEIRQFTSSLGLTKAQLESEKVISVPDGKFFIEIELSKESTRKRTETGHKKMPLVEYKEGFKGINFDRDEIAKVFAECGMVLHRLVDLEILNNFEIKRGESGPIFGHNNFRAVLEISASDTEKLALSFVLGMGKRRSYGLGFIRILSAEEVESRYELKETV